MQRIQASGVVSASEIPGFIVDLAANRAAQVPPPEVTSAPNTSRGEEDCSFYTDDGFYSCAEEAAAEEALAAEPGRNAVEEVSASADRQAAGEAVSEEDAAVEEKIRKELERLAAKDIERKEVAAREEALRKEREELVAKAAERKAARKEATIASRRREAEQAATGVAERKAAEKVAANEAEASALKEAERKAKEAERRNAESKATKLMELKRKISESTQAAARAAEETPKVNSQLMVPQQIVLPQPIVPAKYFEHAREESKCNYRVVQVLNLRILEEAADNAELLGQARRGEELKVLELDESGCWGRIEVRARTTLKGRYYKERGEPDALITGWIRVRDDAQSVSKNLMYLTQDELCICGDNHGDPGLRVNIGLAKTAHFRGA